MRSPLVFLLLVGCHGDPPLPPALEIAEPAAVPGAEKIACRVGPKQSMLPFDDAGLHVRFVTARGNTVSMLGRDVVAGDSADVTLPDAIARIADAHAGAWSDFDVKVTSPAGASAIVKVSLHVDGLMSARIDAARGKPMLFPGETAAPSANKVAWVHPDGATPYVIGEGRWRDIDLVAFDKTDSVPGKACGSTPNGWNDTTLIASHSVSHVELYDRRTGKPIDATTIEGPERCPNDHDAPKFSSAAAIRAWVASKLAP